MGQIFTKTINFRNNVYKHDEDSIEVKWDFLEGFKTEKTAKTAIKKAGQNEDDFTLIKFLGSFYPVSACNKDQGIVISKDFIWFKNKETKDNAVPVFNKHDRKSMDVPDYVIEGTRVAANKETNPMVTHIDEWDPNVDVILAKNSKQKKPMIEACKTLLGQAMFATLVPVHSMEGLNIYFDPKKSPDNAKVWRDGVGFYNPFDGSKEMKYTDGKAYTYTRYLEETQPKKDVPVKKISVLKKVDAEDAIGGHSDPNNIKPTSTIEKSQKRVKAGALKITLPKGMENDSTLIAIQKIFELSSTVDELDIKLNQSIKRINELNEVNKLLLEKINILEETIAQLKADKEDAKAEVKSVGTVFNEDVINAILNEEADDDTTGYTESVENVDEEDDDDLAAILGDLI